jgi:cytochrome c-type biogenesis protein CcmH
VAHRAHRLGPALGGRDRVTLRRSGAWVALVAAGAVVAAALFVAAAAGHGVPTIEEQTQEVASGLRCPVCQNLSVGDSPSPLAGEMRHTIETQLRARRSPAEIRAFFVERYGEWVLLEPPRHGLNLLPWLVPILGLGAGGWLLVRSVGPRPRGSGTPSARAHEVPTRLSAEEHERIERELAALEEAP